MTSPLNSSHGCESSLGELEITYRPPETLRPHARNARTHSRKQIHQIAASISEFGFTNPVLLDRHGAIIAGHARVEAAKELWLATIPTICIDHLSDEQKRAYMLADNRIALNAGWDPEILQIELAELSALELDFDLEITGFETAEIDLIVDGPAPDRRQDPADSAPAVQDGPAVTRPGDLWVLGDHRLLCGSALDPAAYAAVMGDDRARLVFSDPPYNVPVDGHVCGAGSIKHREFAMASGEMSPRQFTEFLGEAFRQAAAVSLEGAMHYYCMDWRHMGEMLAAGEAALLKLKNLCVWVKNNGGMGSFYRSRHELVFVFKHGAAPHVNTIELGRHGRYRTNVWEYAGVNTLRRGRMDELSMHPTVKPVAMMSDAIKDASRRGEIVLDPFGGSGSTLIAAERTRRRARLIEIDPHYCDVIIRRFEALTGQGAVLASTGALFADVAAGRAAETPGGSSPGDGSRQEEEGVS